jgi:hypothetical protein
MKNIAFALCNLIKILPLPTRSERRSFPLLIRWFELNRSHIEPSLPLVQLRDANFEEINFARQKEESIPQHVG